MEQATPALTDDEVARRLELRLNTGWHEYIVRNTHRHHEIYEGMKCRVRFSRFVNGNPRIEVIAQVTLYPHTNKPTPHTIHANPRRERWFFPELEDVQEALRLYGGKRVRMLPY